MIRSKLLPLALAVSVVAPTVATTAAQAAVWTPQANQAFKEGIRDVARLEGAGTKAINIKITCKAVARVNDKGACVGSFELTKNGKTAHYVLTKKARTFRISPGAIEYRVASKATKKVKGLPGLTRALRRLLAVTELRRPGNRLARRGPGRPAPNHAWAWLLPRHHRTHAR